MTATGRDLEGVRIAMVEIMDAVLETLIDDGTLEICKRRFEGRVVVVVDGDGLAWIDQFDDFHSLTGIHSDQEPEDSRSAQVYQGKIDVMETPWDIF